MAFLSPPSIVTLLRADVLDAELAALVWVLVEERIPLVVATPPERLRAGGELLHAVLDSFVPDRRLGADAAVPLDAAAARALVSGQRPGTVVAGGSLEEVRAALAAPPTLMNDDELTFLGTVLVVGPAADASKPQADEPGAGASAASATSGPLRVTAAHYVRPVALDAHGHRQLLGPAVIATWDARLGRYEHFEWGVLPEIAARLGRKAGDLDADLHHRRDDLAGLAKAAVADLAEVQRLVAGYRVAYGHPHAGEPPGLAPEVPPAPPAPPATEPPGKRPH